MAGFISEGPFEADQLQEGEAILQSRWL